MRPSQSDPFLVEVERVRDLESPDAARSALRALEAQARRAAQEAPNDVTAQYRLAAAIGARLEHEDGTAKIDGAAELHDQAARVLALDPEHAGASYMMGKLHASVLRMSGFKRFLAKTLLGGGVLEDASWERAQALLEVAVRKEPCVPEHHFELFRVYTHVGDRAGAGPAPPGISPAQFEQSRARFAEGFFPLKITGSDGGRQTTMQVVSLERRTLEDALFNPPSDYSEVRMPGGAR